jgi:hypothetical protein
LIDYTLPDRPYSEKTLLTLYKKTGDIVAELCNGSVNFSKDGMAEFELNGALKQIVVRKLLFEVYVNLKEIFHEHIHHDDSDHNGADSLLRMEYDVSRDDAVKEIARNYAVKVNWYLKMLKGYAATTDSKKASSEARESAELGFYGIAIQARGEFLFGLNFLESFKDTLGPLYPEYAGDLRRGIESVDIIYSGYEDIRKYHAGKASQESSKILIGLTGETGKTNIRVKVLTYYVLAFAIVSVIISTLSLIKGHFSEHAGILDAIAIISGVAVVALLIINLILSREKTGSS